MIGYTKEVVFHPAKVNGVVVEKLVRSICAVKEVAKQVGELFEKLESTGGLDQRWITIGKTNLQQGFMALTRAIAQPTTF